MPCFLGVSFEADQDPEHRYGGIFERGSKEYTLDDFYALQLDKMDRYLCLKKSDVIIPVEGEEESSSDEDDEDEGDEDDEEGDGDDDGDDSPDAAAHAPVEAETEVEGKGKDVSNSPDCMGKGLIHMTGFACQSHPVLGRV